MDTKTFEELSMERCRFCKQMENRNVFKLFIQNLKMLKSLRVGGAGYFKGYNYMRMPDCAWLVARRVRA